MSAPLPEYGAPVDDPDQWYDPTDDTVHGVTGEDLAARHLLDQASAPGRPDDDRPSRRPKFRDAAMRLSQLSQLPPVEPLIDGLVYRHELTQLSGAPGSYKSFLAVAMACAVAAGVPFEDHRVHEGGGRVLYVVAEGASGLQARVLAWCELTRIDPATIDDRLIVLPLPVQLGDRVDVAEAIELARELEVELVVIDTRARCTRGLDENSNTAQEPAISAADAFTTEAGSAVLLVHHLGRNGLTPRGANAWDGAVWSDLRLKSEYLRTTLNCQKHKDVPAGCDHEFRLIPHTVSPDLMPNADEEARRTLVVVAGDGRPVPEETSRSVAAVLGIIEACDGSEGLSRSQIRDLAVDAGISRSQAYSAVKQLVERAQVRNIATGKIPRYVLAGGPALYPSGTDR